ncbi:MAG: hypothetical protein Q9181_007602 [Wetmoreana brouardii]
MPLWSDNNIWTDGNNALDNLLQHGPIRYEVDERFLYLKYVLKAGSYLDSEYDRAGAPHPVDEPSAREYLRIETDDVIILKNFAVKSRECYGADQVDYRTVWTAFDLLHMPHTETYEAFSHHYLYGSKSPMELQLYSFWELYTDRLTILNRKLLNKEERQLARAAEKLETARIDHDMAGMDMPFEYNRELIGENTRQLMIEEFRTGALDSLDDSEDNPFKKESNKGEDGSQDGESGEDGESDENSNDKDDSEEDIEEQKGREEHKVSEGEESKITEGENFDSEAGAENTLIGEQTQDEDIMLATSKETIVLGDAGNEETPRQNGTQIPVCKTQGHESGHQLSGPMEVDQNSDGDTVTAE